MKKQLQVRFVGLAKLVEVVAQALMHEKKKSCQSSNPLIKSKRIIEIFTENFKIT